MQEGGALSDDPWAGSGCGWVHGLCPFHANGTQAMNGTQTITLRADFLQNSPNMFPVM